MPALRHPVLRRVLLVHAPNGTNRHRPYQWNRAVQPHTGDPAVANWGSDDVTSLRWGGEEGLVRSGEQIGVGRAPLALEAADYDGDGFLDLALSSSEDDSVTLLRGSPQGLRAAGEIAVGDFPTALASGDHDGDGFPDLVVATTGDDEVAFRRRRAASSRRLLRCRPDSGRPRRLRLRDGQLPPRPVTRRRGCSARVLPGTPQAPTSQWLTETGEVDPPGHVEKTEKCRRILLTCRRYRHRLRTCRQKGVL